MNPEFTTKSGWDTTIKPTFDNFFTVNERFELESEPTDRGTKITVRLVAQNVFEEFFTWAFQQVGIWNKDDEWTHVVMQDIKFHDLRGLDSKEERKIEIEKIFNATVTKVPIEDKPPLEIVNKFVNSFNEGVKKRITDLAQEKLRAMPVSSKAHGIPVPGSKPQEPSEMQPPIGEETPITGRTSEPQTPEIPDIRYTDVTPPIPEAPSATPAPKTKESEAKVEEKKRFKEFLIRQADKFAKDYESILSDRNQPSHNTIVGLYHDISKNSYADVPLDQAKKNWNDIQRRIAQLPQKKSSDEKPSTTGEPPAAQKEEVKPEASELLKTQSSIRELIKEMKDTSKDVRDHKLKMQIVKSYSQLAGSISFNKDINTLKGQLEKQSKEFNEIKKSLAQAQPTLAETPATEQREAAGAVKTSEPETSETSIISRQSVAEEFFSGDKISTLSKAQVNEFITFLQDFQKNNQTFLSKMSRNANQDLNELIDYLTDYINNPEASVEELSLKLVPFQKKLAELKRALPSTFRESPREIEGSAPEIEDITVEHDALVNQLRNALKDIPNSNDLHAQIKNAIDSNKPSAELKELETLQKKVEEFKSNPPEEGIWETVTDEELKTDKALSEIEARIDSNLEKINKAKEKLEFVESKLSSAGDVRYDTIYAALEEKTKALEDLRKGRVEKRFMRSPTTTPTTQMDAGALNKFKNDIDKTAKDLDSSLKTIDEAYAAFQEYAEKSQKIKDTRASLLKKEIPQYSTASELESLLKKEIDVENAPTASNFESLTKQVKEQSSLMEARLGKLGPEKELIEQLQEVEASPQKFSRNEELKKTIKSAILTSVQDDIESTQRLLNDSANAVKEQPISDQNKKELTEQINSRYTRLQDLKNNFTYTEVGPSYPTTFAVSEQEETEVTKNLSELDSSRLEEWTDQVSYLKDEAETYLSTLSKTAEHLKRAERQPVAESTVSEEKPSVPAPPPAAKQEVTAEKAVPKEDMLKLKASISETVDVGKSVIQEQRKKLDALKTRFPGATFESIERQITRREDALDEIKKGNTRFLGFGSTVENMTAEQLKTHQQYAQQQVSDERDYFADDPLHMKEMDQALNALDEQKKSAEEIKKSFETNGQYSSTVPVDQAVQEFEQNILETAKSTRSLDYLARAITQEMPKLAERLTELKNRSEQLTFLQQLAQIPKEDTEKVNRVKNAHIIQVQAKLKQAQDELRNEKAKINSKLNELHNNPEKPLEVDELKEIEKRLEPYQQEEIDATVGYIPGFRRTEKRKLNSLSLAELTKYEADAMSAIKTAKDKLEESSKAVDKFDKAFDTFDSKREEAEDLIEQLESGPNPDFLKAFQLRKTLDGVEKEYEKLTPITTSILNMDKEAKTYGSLTGKLQGTIDQINKETKPTLPIIDQLREIDKSRAMKKEPLFTELRERIHEAYRNEVLQASTEAKNVIKKDLETLDKEPLSSAIHPELKDTIRQELNRKREALEQLEQAPFSYEKEVVTGAIALGVDETEIQRTTKPISELNDEGLELWKAKVDEAVKDAKDKINLPRLNEALEDLNVMKEYSTNRATHARDSGQAVSAKEIESKLNRINSQQNEVVQHYLQKAKQFQSDKPIGTYLDEAVDDYISWVEDATSTLEDIEDLTLGLEEQLYRLPPNSDEFKGIRKQFVQDVHKTIDKQEKHLSDMASTYVNLFKKVDIEDSFKKSIQEQISKAQTAAYNLKLKTEGDFTSAEALTAYRKEVEESIQNTKQNLEELNATARRLDIYDKTIVDLEKQKEGYKKSFQYDLLGMLEAVEQKAAAFTLPKIEDELSLNEFGRERKNIAEMLQDSLDAVKEKSETGPSALSTQFMTLSQPQYKDTSAFKLCKQSIINTAKVNIGLIKNSLNALPDTPDNKKRKDDLDALEARFTENSTTLLKDFEKVMLFSIS